MRTDVAFQQDPETHQLLERVGLELFGIQAIGLWHSHHRLGLEELSSGDLKRTISMAQRTQRARFCDVLCYLSGRADEVTVKPYVYVDARAGERAPTTFELLEGDSPIRTALDEGKVTADVRAALAEALAPAPPGRSPPFRLARSIPGDAGRVDDDQRSDGGRRGWFGLGRRSDGGDTQGTAGDEAPVPIPDPALYVANYVEPALRRAPRDMVCELDAHPNGYALRLTMTLQPAARSGSVVVDLGWDGRAPQVTSMAVHGAEGDIPIDQAKLDGVKVDDVIQLAVSYLNRSRFKR